MKFNRTDFDQQTNQIGFDQHLLWQANTAMANDQQKVGDFNAQHGNFTLNLRFTEPTKYMVNNVKSYQIMSAIYTMGYEFPKHRSSPRENDLNLHSSAAKNKWTYAEGEQQDSRCTCEVIVIIFSMNQP